MLSKLKHHCDLLRLGRIWGSGKGIVEPSPQIAMRKQIHAQQRYQIRQRPTPLRFQLHEAQHQHRNQRRPYLGLHRGGRGAHEGLDLQVLFQGFKQLGDILPINNGPLKSKFTTDFTRYAVGLFRSLGCITFMRSRAMS